MYDTGNGKTGGTANRQPRPVRVLIISDDACMRRLLGDVVQTHCVNAKCALIDAREEAQIAVAADAADVCICTTNPSRATTFESLRLVRMNRPELVTIVLVPADSPKFALEAMNIGAQDVLVRAPGYLDQLPLMVLKHARGGMRHLSSTSARSNMITPVGVARSRMRVALAGMRRENHALKSKLTSLESLAGTDALTELPNRRWITQRARELASSASRHGQELSVLVIDLDGLKSMNDALGHSAGDEFLQLAAATIRGCLRESDAAGRIGGDEFVVFLPCTSMGGASQVAERMLTSMQQRSRALAERVNCAGNGRPAHTPGMSIGIATKSQLENLRAGAGSDELLELADRAMYEAKRLGGGRAMRASDVNAVKEHGASTTNQPTIKVRPGSSRKAA